MERDHQQPMAQIARGANRSCPGFIVPSREWRRLRRRAYDAQQAGHLEVAGLFAVDTNRKIFLIFLKNESRREMSFEFGWQQFNQARKLIRQKHGRYIGIFHSHPIGYAEPGPGDIRHTKLNSFALIYDVCGNNARLWHIVSRGRKKIAVERSLQIERSPQRRFKRKS